MLDRVVEPAEIVQRLREQGAVLLDDPAVGKRCPVTNAWHRITQAFSDVEYRPNMLLEAGVNRGMRDMLYRAIFAKWPTADIHDCTAQVWAEPCVTFTPHRQRCESFHTAVNVPHIHAYARVNYSEESLPRIRLHEQRIIQ